jgi:hypothetical protein
MLGAATAGSFLVLMEQSEHLGFVRFGAGIHPHHVHVYPAGEAAIFIEYVRYAVGHARAEIAADRTEDENEPSGHVLAAVVASAFDYGNRA